MRNSITKLISRLPRASVGAQEEGILTTCGILTGSKCNKYPNQVFRVTKPAVDSACTRLQVEATTLSGGGEASCYNCHGKENLSRDKAAQPLNATYSQGRTGTVRLSIQQGRMGTEKMPIQLNSECSYRFIKRTFLKDLIECSVCHTDTW